MPQVCNFSWSFMMIFVFLTMILLYCSFNLIMFYSSINMKNNFYFYFISMIL